MKRKIFTFSVLLFAFAITVHAQKYFEWADKTTDQFTKNFISSSNKKIVTDSDGNSYVIGHWKGEAKFETIQQGPILKATNRDSYLVKYNPQGSIVWIRFITQNAADNLDWVHIESITIDKSNQVYITGTYSAPSVKFAAPNQTLWLQNGNASSNILVANYHPNGNLTWAISYGSKSYHNYAVDIEYSPVTDRLYIGGHKSNIETLGNKKSSVWTVKKDGSDFAEYDTPAWPEEALPDTENWITDIALAHSGDQVNVITAGNYIDENTVIGGNFNDGDKYGSITKTYIFNIDRKEYHLYYNAFYRSYTLNPFGTSTYEYKYTDMSPVVEAEGEKVAYALNLSSLVHEDNFIDESVSGCADCLWYEKYGPTENCDGIPDEEQEDVVPCDQQSMSVYSAYYRYHKEVIYDNNLNEWTITTSEYDHIGLPNHDTWSVAMCVDMNLDFIAPIEVSISISGDPFDSYAQIIDLDMTDGKLRYAGNYYGEITVDGYSIEDDNCATQTPIYDIFIGKVGDYVAVSGGCRQDWVNGIDFRKGEFTLVGYFTSPIIHFSPNDYIGGDGEVTLKNDEANIPPSSNIEGKPTAYIARMVEERLPPSTPFPTPGDKKSGANPDTGSGLVVNPNPTTGDNIRFTYTATTREQIKVSLTDAISGAVVYTQGFDVTTGENTLSFAVRGLTVGTYILRAESTTGVVTERVMIE